MNLAAYAAIAGCSYTILAKRSPITLLASFHFGIGSERLVQIDGFTDSVGTDSFNQDLSQHRADAVRYQLVSRGISATRIGTQGYGKAYPVASNSESSGRQLNRRVGVVIGADNGTAIAARGT